jgi:ribonuclease HI
LLGLRKARAMEIQRLVIKTDSQVVAGHIEKDYKARDPELAKYLQFLREQEKYLEGFIVKNISRTDNSDADEIAKVAAQNTSFPQDVFFQILNKLPSKQNKTKQNKTRSPKRSLYNTKLRLKSTNHGIPSRTLRTRRRN